MVAPAVLPAASTRMGTAVTGVTPTGKIGPPRIRFSREDFPELTRPKKATSTVPTSSRSTMDSSARWDSMKPCSTTICSRVGSRARSRGILREPLDPRSQIAGGAAGEPVPEPLQ
jgi:hypothetical protein